MLTAQFQYFLFAGVIVISLTVSHSFELPFLQACTFEDEKCHAEQVTKFLEIYGTGIEELNITDLNRMEVGDISIKGNSNENFNLNLFMENVVLYKYPMSKCLNFKGFSKDIDKPMHITLKTFTPQLILDSHCRVDGKILLFKLAGETDLTIDTRNLTTIFKVKVVSYKKDGKVYLKAEEMKPQLKIGGISISFANSTLFNGEQVFMDTFAETINKNWEIFRDDMEPALSGPINNVLLKILNKILVTIPYEKYFKKSDEKNENEQLNPV